VGSFSILNNIAAINGQNQLNINNVNLTRTLNRLSSGKRINSGADDAAGLQIADSLRANYFALNQAVRNANDGISFCQIADGALQEITNILTRCVTLAEEAATETIDNAGKKALDNEFQILQKELARIAVQTNFNGTKLFSENRDFGDTLDIFVGDVTDASFIEVSIGVIKVDNMTSPSKVTSFGNIANSDLSVVSLGTATAASSALGIFRTTLNAISTMRGTIGAGMNRLNAAVSVMQTQATNTLSAESSVRDANIAEEITSMTKYQILAQSGIAALAQANSNSQTVLRLLQ
jgi:flagellin